jgi:transposase
MARGDLTDAQWERLSRHLPPENDPHKRGNRYKDHRTVINGILWVDRAGAPWPGALWALPERYGPWQTCYDRFRCWQRDGTWQRLLQALQQEADSGRLPGQEVDWQGCAADSTSIKAHPHAAGLGVIVRPRNAEKKRVRTVRAVRVRRARKPELTATANASVAAAEA